MALRSLLTYLFVFFCSLCSISALAIGDSAGGCGIHRTPENSPLLKAAIDGSPADIAREVDIEADRYTESAIAKMRQSGELGTRLRLFLSKRALAKWKNAKRVEQRSVVLNSPVYCSSGGWLLEYAVAAGNVPVVRWLLDAGADPNAQTSNDNIFTRCIPNPRKVSRPISSSETESISSRLEALDLVISRGGDLKRPVGFGETALDLCHDPELLPFYISRGAELSPRWSDNKFFHPMQSAISDALGDRTWERGLDRVKVLARAGANDIRGLRVESVLRRKCRDQKHETTCNEIARYVKSTPGTFPSIGLYAF
jgi:hypothetical protein